MSFMAICFIKFEHEAPVVTFHIKELMTLPRTPNSRFNVYHKLFHANQILLAYKTYLTKNCSVVYTEFIKPGSSFQQHGVEAF